MSRHLIRGLTLLACLTLPAGANGGAPEDHGAVFTKLEDAKCYLARRSENENH
jgi:hypothetical protein